MAEKWYPVIDYMTCTECGLCAAKCTHGVYDKEKAPTPVVKNPAACIDRCRFCANNCPASAISYVGDNGDAKAADSCCGGCCCRCDDDEPETCGCGCETDEVCCGDDDEECRRCGDVNEISCGAGEPEKRAAVEYLYLDLHTCDRCMGTGAVLDEVMEVLSPALTLAGYAVEYRKTEMETAETARRYRFLSSPTIRVNGRDICKSVAESPCACCGDISGTDVDCRVFPYGGETYEVPPKEMLAEAILKALFAGDGGEDCGCGEPYELPDNLKDFFMGKSQKTAGRRMDSCC